MELNASQLDVIRSLIQQWGYFIVFAGMLVENAGIPIPGETLTLLAGYTAGNGHINPFGVVAAAASGAILGDNIGFWVGRRYGWRIILGIGRLLGQDSDKLLRLKSGFLRRAGLSVFLGRFIALLRVLAGPMAGAVGMPYRRFLFFNSAGAVLWSSSMVSIAWLSGKWIPIERLIDIVAKAGLVGLSLIALLCLAAWKLAQAEGKWLSKRDQDEE